VRGAERYPLALAALERLLGSRAARPRGDVDEASDAPFAVGPGILRPPPEVQRRARPAARPLEEGAPVDVDTEEMLGELVDMVFVSADDDAGSGHPEVHLVFKAEVLGGLHLKLVKKSDGMHATFIVEDAAARRAVLASVDGIVTHLKGRGFAVAHHEVQIASAPAEVP
jgi:hypothetical protein